MRTHLQVVVSMVVDHDKLLTTTDEEQIINSIADGVYYVQHNHGMTKNDTVYVGDFDFSYTERLNLNE